MSVDSAHLERPPGHAFISYVHEDAGRVDRLVEALEDAGIKIWRDREDIAPGADWRAEIERAITEGALVFIACFSSNYEKRGRTFQNEELILAAEQIRLRPIGHTWYIPVRFDECSTPKYSIGAGRNLSNIQHLDLFENDDWERSVRRLVAAIVRVLSASVVQPKDLLTEATTVPNESTARRVRRLILEPTKRLVVEDIYEDAAEDLRSTYSDTVKFPLVIPADAASSTDLQVRYITNQAHAYCDEAMPLAELLVAGCSSGASDYNPVWARSFQILSSELLKMQGGQTVLLNLRKLPLILLAYSACLAAMSRVDLSVIRAVTIDARITNDHGERVPLIRALHTYYPFDGLDRTATVFAYEAKGNRLSAAELQKHLRGRVGKRFTPVSDYVAEKIRPFFRRLLPDDHGFTEMFDSLEIYLGVIATYEAKRVKDGGAYIHGPWFGSFTWRDRRSVNEKVESRIGREMSEPTWPGYSVGLLGGSPDAAGVAIDEFIDRSDKVRSQRFY